MKQKRFAIFIGILVILGLAYWYASHKQANAPETNTTPAEGTENTIPSNSNSATTTPGVNAIVVSTQQAGSSVTVDNFNLSKPGFIAIYTADVDGGPKTLIGQSKLLSGSGQDLEINAAVASGKAYVAVLYLDNGDKKFSSSSDTIAKTGSLPSMAVFSVTK